MARRILILMDDYSEATRIETMLRKLGFDTVVQVTETGLQDQLLGFRPDMVLVAGHGAKLSASSVGLKLKEAKTFHGKVIIGLPKGEEMSPQDFLRVRVDRVIELPCSDESLLRHIGEIFGMGPKVLIDKMRKSFYLGAPETVQHIKHLESSPEPEGAATASAPEVQVPEFSLKSSLSESERQNRYDYFASELDVDASATKLKRGEVRDRWTTVKSEWDPVAVEAQNRLKREFAKALFEGDNDESLNAENAKNPDPEEESS